MVSVVEKTGKPGRPKGTPKTGGRKKGVPNKATASLKDLARKHTDAAINTLYTIMLDGEEPAAARISAASTLLDRGYGKPSSVISGDEDGGPIKTYSEIRIVGVRSD